MITNEAELRKFIRDEVARQANVILSGQAGANEAVVTETIDNLYPGSPSFIDRPIMHPFGFVSRAVRSILSVTARQGENPGNRMVLGHRDADRPTELDEGAAWMYSKDGWRVQCNNDGVKITNEDESTMIDIVDGEINFVAGNATGKFSQDGKFSFSNAGGEFVAQIIALFQDIQNGVTSTSLGPQQLQMPTFADDLALLQTFSE